VTHEAKFRGHDLAPTGHGRGHDPALQRSRCAAGAGSSSFKFNLGCADDTFHIFYSMKHFRFRCRRLTYLVVRSTGSDCVNVIASMTSPLAVPCATTSSNLPLHQLPQTRLTRRCVIIIFSFAVVHAHNRRLIDLYAYYTRRRKFVRVDG